MPLGLGRAAPVTTGAAGFAAPVAAGGHRTDDVEALHDELLTLAPQVESDEMAQVLQGNLAAKLELEGHRAVAVGAGLLTHLDDQIPRFGTGEDQLAPDREVVIALGQLVGAGGRAAAIRLGGFMGLCPLGFGARGRRSGQRAGFPHSHHLQVELVFLPGAGIDHPQVGGLQIEVPAHQGEQAAQHHRLDLGALVRADHAPGELVGVGGYIAAAHHSDGPVLHRLGDRGNGMLAHGGSENPVAMQGRARVNVSSSGSPMPRPDSEPHPRPLRQRMPSSSRRLTGLWSLLAAITIGGLALGGGWWLGQRQSATKASADPKRTLLTKEATRLQLRVDADEAGPADRQRLLELLVALDRKAEAIRLLEPMADREPGRWSLRLVLAELRRDQNDLTGAERELRQILNLRPTQVEALQLISLLNLEQGRGAAAEARVKAAYAMATKPEVRPEALGIGLLLAELQLKRKQVATAAATYGQLAGFFPKDQRPLLGLALLRHDQGDPKGAQEALAQARLRAPEPDKPDPRLDKLAASWGLEPLRSPSAAPKTPPGPAPSSARQSP